MKLETFVKTHLALSILLCMVCLAGSIYLTYVIKESEVVDDKVEIKADLTFIQASVILMVILQIIIVLTVRNDYRPYALVISLPILAILGYLLYLAFTTQRDGEAYKLASDRKTQLAIIGLVLSVLHVILLGVLLLCSYVVWQGHIEVIPIDTSVMLWTGKDPSELLLEQTDLYTVA